MTALVHHRYPWTPADERFLIRARRDRFGHKAIARALSRTPQSISARLKRLDDAGVLIDHRAEEMKLLAKLLAEERGS